MNRLLVAALFFVSFPAAAQDEEKETPVEAAPGELAPVEAAPVQKNLALVGRATVQGVGGPGRRLTLFNDSEILWTGVVVTLNDSITCRLPSVKPMDHDGILLPKCTGDVLSNVQIHQVVIEANEEIVVARESARLVRETASAPR